jgi:hypothetical protein
MKKQSLEAQFEEKFRDYRLTPSTQVWQTIETELQQTSATRRKALPVWWAAAASGALLVSTSIGYNYYHKDAPTNTIATTTSNSTAKNQEDTTTNLTISPKIQQDEKVKNTSSPTTQQALTESATVQTNSTHSNNEPKRLEKASNKNTLLPLPMQQTLPVVPQNEVATSAAPSTNTSNKPTLSIADIKPLPNTMPRTIAVPTSPVTVSLSSTNAEKEAIVYENSPKQPIFSAWRELNDAPQQDSTASERLLHLAESKAKRLVKRVDIAGIWSDFKTLRGF